MSVSLLRRISRLEAVRDDDILIFTHERQEPDGSLTLLNDRTFGEEPRIVGHVPAGEVTEFRRRLIRISPARWHD
ncbi:MAG: hypothetical protein N3C63_01750 [Rhodocyclaceae bacterium]|nr:hypothetical protein [Rhodocyclaceae bacterium]